MEKLRLRDFKNNIQIVKQGFDNDYAGSTDARYHIKFKALIPLFNNDKCIFFSSSHETNSKEISIYKNKATLMNHIKYIISQDIHKYYWLYELNNNQEWWYTDEYPIEYRGLLLNNKQLKLLAYEYLAR